MRGMTLGRRLLLLAGLFVVASPVAGAERVKEAATGVAFQVQDGDMVLVGTGVRTKLVFNVYAAALYADPAGLREAAGGKTGVAALSRAVQFGAFKRRIILHFVRDVPAAKVQGAFRDSLVANMSAGDYEAEKANIDEFLSKCPDIKKGQQFALYSQGSRTLITLNGTRLYETRSVRLSRGMWGSYFGKRPISRELQKGLLSRAEQILAAAR